MCATSVMDDPPKMERVYSDVETLSKESDLTKFWQHLRTYNGLIEESIRTAQTPNPYGLDSNTSVFTNELRKNAPDLWLDVEQTKSSANFYSPLLIVMNASESMLKTVTQTVLEPSLITLVSEWKGSIALTNAVSTREEEFDMGDQSSDPAVRIKTFEVTKFDQDLVTHAMKTISVSDGNSSDLIMSRDVKFVITVGNVFV